jgi:hypothetical protein
LTDHNPLVYINNLTLKSRNLTKWRLLLAQYNFKVEYKKGILNKNADALSRITIATIEELTTLSDDEIRKHQMNDLKLANIIEKANKNKGEWNEYKLENGILFNWRSVRNKNPRQYNKS